MDTSSWHGTQLSTGTTLLQPYISPNYKFIVVLCWCETWSHILM